VTRERQSTAASENATATGGQTADARRARIETDHGDAATARRVAAALAPDNTDSIATGVEATRVVTTIERPTTAGLQSTVDDYVCNLQVGARLAADTTDATTTTAETEATTDTTDTTETTDT